MKIPVCWDVTLFLNVSSHFKDCNALIFKVKQYKSYETVRNQSFKDTVSQHRRNELPAALLSERHTLHSTTKCDVIRNSAKVKECHFMNLQRKKFKL
jgi:hypothetical protein